MEHKYTKKPVTIEAFQMTPERRWDNNGWPQWLHEAWQSGVLFIKPDGTSQYLCIKTLEGIHDVGWGDFIIQGVKGELYPCKPDIFEMTYDPA